MGGAYSILYLSAWDKARAHWGMNEWMSELLRQEQEEEDQLRPG